jgi:hypothetical protein
MHGAVDDSGPSGDPWLDHDHEPSNSHASRSFGKKKPYAWQVMQDICHDHRTQTRVDKRERLCVEG